MKNKWKKLNYHPLFGEVPVAVPGYRLLFWPKMLNMLVLSKLCFYHSSILALYLACPISDPGALYSLNTNYFILVSAPQSHKTLVCETQSL
jgi:hypothetical protein